MRNIPTDLLRTFVTVVDLGGFTSASEALGRSQPAISLQIKRLEDLLQTQLFLRTGHTPQMSEEGKTLLEYARQILYLNDDAIIRLSKSSVSGTIKLGIPDEFSLSFLPEILGKFAQSHPNVALLVTCDLSVNLLAKLNSYDLVVAMHADAVPESVLLSWSEELVWVTGPSFNVHVHAPLPLIVAPEGCVYRNRILTTLNRFGKPWRIMYTSTSYGSVQAGVLAGLGVTALAASTVPENLRVLGPSDQFPSLNPAEIGLHFGGDRRSGAVLRLADYMAARLSRLRTLESELKAVPQLIG